MDEVLRWARAPLPTRQGLLLGDPAVTLPLTRQEQAVRPSSQAERVSSLLGMPVAGAPTGAARSQPPAEAVLAMLSGKERHEAIAERVGVTLQEPRRWEQVYKDAGLVALARLRS